MGIAFIAALQYNEHQEKLLYGMLNINALALSWKYLNIVNGELWILI